MMRRYLTIILASFMLCLMSISFADNAWAQGSTKQPTINGTAAQQSASSKLGKQSGSSTDLSGSSVKNSGSTGEKDSGNSATTSGKVEFTGDSSLSSDYGMGGCGSGNIFQQLACRAGVIGSGLKTVGYMIAGFGLIVFSFMAIFGKVKWPVFATIMFCCFLLSATVFVINMMTEKGDASWIGGIEAGSISASATDQPKGNTDANEISKQNS